MKIVRMEKRHIPALVRLEAVCFSTPWTEAGLEAELSKDTAVFFVAEREETGEVLGYAGMEFVCGEGYLDNVAVFPKARRQGAGKALVGALLTYAKTHGGSFVTLEVRPSNAAAIALYESLGFAEAGRRRHFYRDPMEDALLLTRRF